MMKALLVGNCMLEELAQLLRARGHETHFTYIANPLTLLYSDRIPEGLPEMTAHFQIEDRLEKRALSAQFQGISPENDCDVIFVYYYHELRPLLHHRREKYFLHLNFQAVRAFEEDHLRDMGALFTENLKKTRRFLKLRNNFRTVFRISPRKSPLPALGLFL
jgi:hypothetical protein